LPGDRPPPSEGAPNIAPEPRTAFATGTLSATSTLTAVSLEKEADRVGVSVDDRVKLSDAGMRRWMASRVVRVFVQANCVTLVALGALVLLDEINIGFHLVSPGDRIITNQVIMTLLGATTVQVGAIAVIIARYLFPGRADGK